MTDSCDDCTHWIGNMPKTRCIGCNEIIGDVMVDSIDKERCCDCAAEHREKAFLSDCCGANLDGVAIAESETEGTIYADYYTCSACGRQTDD